MVRGYLYCRWPGKPFTAPSGENWFPLEYNAVTDGVCGTADGSTFNYADYDTQDWCSAGDFYFSGTEYNGTMLYSCTGTGGGTTDNCSASYYINGDCGTVSGTTQTSLGIENENLCSYNYLIDETSFLLRQRAGLGYAADYMGGMIAFVPPIKQTFPFRTCRKQKTALLIRSRIIGYATSTTQ